jgi:hypothetical protein
LKGENMKKVKNERPTWALFRHVPNNKKGQEFLRMFKLHKNLEVVNHFIRYRKPKPGTSYSHGGHCKPENGTEFSIYVRGNTNWLGNYKESQSNLKRVRNELHEVEEAFAQCTEDLATMEDIATENYNNRCDWRNSYYEVIQSSFWFWFKLRYAPFGRYLFRKLTFWRNHS